MDNWHQEGFRRLTEGGNGKMQGGKKEGRKERSLELVVIKLNVCYYGMCAPPTTRAFDTSKNLVLFRFIPKHHYSFHFGKSMH